MDLTKFWEYQYGDRIYKINYEKLTIDQESETKSLIALLDLKWERACLFPQENFRSVKTASQQQVRRKVYKGSSQAWRNYEPFIDGAFDNLTNTI